MVGGIGKRGQSLLLPRRKPVSQPLQLFIGCLDAIGDVAAVAIISVLHLVLVQVFPSDSTRSTIHTCSTSESSHRIIQLSQLIQLGWPRCHVLASKSYPLPGCPGWAVWSSQYGGRIEPHLFAHANIPFSVLQVMCLDGVY